MRKSLYSEEFHRVRNLLHHGGKRTSRFLSSFEMTVLLFVPDYAALRPGYMLTSPSPTSTLTIFAIANGSCPILINHAAFDITMNG